MNIFLIFSFFATCFINLVEVQEVAITYTTRYIAGPKKLYIYCGETYFSPYELKEKILDDFYFVEPSHLLLTEINPQDVSVGFNPKNHKFRKVIDSALQITLLKYLIIVFCGKKGPIFVINGKSYYTFGFAERRVKHLIWKDRKSKEFRPYLPLHPPMKDNILGNKKIFCYRFWKTLWGSCDYYCYSKNRFGVMKQKFLTEIGYYRWKHGSENLVENERLSQLALKLLRSMISRKYRVDIKKYENVGKGNRYTAPLIINRWYGEHKDYNYITGGYSPNTSHFTAMVWKNAKQIGIAILQSANTIYVKVIYDVAPKKEDSYIKNVLRPFLSEINYYRMKHNASGLVENQHFSNVAQHSLSILLRNTRKMNVKRFDNIGKGNVFTAPLIVNEWYGEHKNYNYNSNIGSRGTRHFTALVWKSAKQIGFGVVRKGDRIYVKFYFDKSINIPNLYRQNVDKPISSRFRDPRLSQLAERSLERIILREKKIDPTKHENVAKASLDLAPLMINSWYRERKDYDYKSKHGNLTAKHFTAMVWKSSKAVGFGIVKVGHSIYLKVVYDTLTNLPYQFRKNVHKKVKKRKYWKKY
uniref:SCP domain-containing protein n=1 Tax=Strongyloides papillosus TaxID=174720 RepID=A0A0N5BLQ0_STREA